MTLIIEHKEASGGITPRKVPLVDCRKAADDHPAAWQNTECDSEADSSGARFTGRQLGELSEEPALPLP
ncbi:MAG TPA: hypothetical protein VK428_00935 [Acidimicrobiales bacterium]|nr:hypothetical protein [Acidimicrobiales bacterium]